MDLVSTTDTNGDGIDDDYEAAMQVWMATYGIEGTYDPDADYNGDGISNRDHYHAGTDPFAGATPEPPVGDDLVISAASLVTMSTGDGFIQIHFYAFENHTYAVLSTTNLIGDTWFTLDNATSFRMTPDGSERTRFNCMEAGWVDIYVPADLLNDLRAYRLYME